MQVIALEEVSWPVDTSYADLTLRDHTGARLADLVDFRVYEMDEYGIDLQVLSPIKPGMQRRFDTAAAIDDAKRRNDLLANVIAEHPTRFAGLAALPWQDPTAAAHELACAVEEFGFVGALVNGSTHGHYMDEPQYEPVWAELERLDVPLYLNPTEVPVWDRWAVLEGYPELSGPMYRWVAETGAHALRLVLGGVFDRHPTAKLILGHMGALLPFQLARLDSRHECNTHALKYRPSYYVRNNIFATTSAPLDIPGLYGAIQAVGIDNILLSLDYPATAEAAKYLRDLSISLFPADHAKITHANAKRILKVADASCENRVGKGGKDRTAI